MATQGWVRAGRALGKTNLSTRILEDMTLGEDGYLDPAQVDAVFRSFAPVRGRWQLNPARQRVEFKLADFWIGVFWQVSDSKKNAGQVRVKISRNGETWEANRQHIKRARRLDVWICLVPCLPIHLILTKRLPGLYR